MLEDGLPVYEARGIFNGIMEWDTSIWTIRMNGLMVYLEVSMAWTCIS